MPSDYGIKVSQPGVDVFSATDDQLLLNSGQTLLKTYMQGVATGTDGTFSPIYHGLGYRPQFLVYGLRTGTGDDDHITFMETSNPSFEFDGIYAAVSTNYLYLYGDSYMDSAYYFIFLEGI